MIEVDAANRGVRLYNGMKIDWENGSNGLVGREGNAEEGTRTPTAFRPPAPKAGASANSATSACGYTITRAEPIQTLGPLEAHAAKSGPVASATIHFKYARFFSDTMN